MSEPTPARHQVRTGADGRPVLVKRSATPAGRARLSTEAAILRDLDHPSLVRVAALREDDHATELHLEWVAGGHSLDTAAPPDLTTVAEVVSRLAEIVADLHEAGIAHRRLTPDHVLVAPDGTVVLAGLAEATTDRTFPADDVDALGALLTDLVLGHDAGPLVPERRRGLGGDGGRRAVLLTLADRARADDPDDRPTAAQLAADVGRVVGRPERRPRRRDVVDVPPPHPRPLTAASPPPPAAADHRSGEPRPVRPRVAIALPPSHRRRRVAVVVAGIATALTVGAALALDAPRDGEVSTASSFPTPTTSGPVDPEGTEPARAEEAVPASGDDARTTTTVGPPPTTVPSPPPSSAADEVPTTPPPAEALPAGCPEPWGPTAVDVDGDGCPEAVLVEGARVTVGTTTWRTGDPGDLTVVADWDCDGLATPATLRPGTGEVFVFDRWVAPTERLTVTPTAIVDGATDLRRGDDPDRCPDLVVVRGDDEVVVEVGA